VRTRVGVLAGLLSWNGTAANLASVLFEEWDREAARKRCQSPVEKAYVPETTQAAATKWVPEGLPVQSADAVG